MVNQQPLVARRVVKLVERIVHLARRNVVAQVCGRDGLERMRFVEYHDIVVRQDAAARRAQCKIAEEQGMIDHQDLRVHDAPPILDRKSTRLNSSHVKISYAVFCLKKKKITSSGCT